ncbi:MAG TPA: tetratricopeptide repeat protein, partial [Gemmatimonadaceae bacterium]|nr:tetratricopeptide repeat protein [Gemmatimonadaceae bacterium]
MAEQVARAISAHREMLQALDAKLDAPEASAQRDALKDQIINFYRSIEQEIADLTTLKDDVKKLVDKWKALQAGATLAPEFTGEKPVVHADHIGASTFIEKGWSRLSLGDYPAAEQALKRAIELSPNDPQSEALLGWALMLQEKYDEALGWFQRVLTRDPQNSLARINIGYISVKKKNWTEATENLSRAIRLNNDKKATLYAHFYLGLAYLERDMFEDAQTFFQKTIALGPNLIEAYYELGRAFWFNGQQDEAMDAWKRGHAANKFNP